MMTVSIAALCLLRQEDVAAIDDDGVDDRSGRRFSVLSVDDRRQSQGYPGENKGGAHSGIIASPGTLGMVATPTEVEGDAPSGAGP